MAKCPEEKMMKNVHPSGEPHASICCVIRDLRYEKYSGISECLAKERMQLVKYPGCSASGCLKLPLRHKCPAQTGQKTCSPLPAMLGPVTMGLCFVSELYQPAFCGGLVPSKNAGGLKSRPGVMMLGKNNGNYLTFEQSPELGLWARILIY